MLTSFICPPIHPLSTVASPDQKVIVKKKRVIFKKKKRFQQKQEIEMRI